MVDAARVKESENGKMITIICNPTDSVKVNSPFGTRKLLSVDYHNGIDIGPVVSGKDGDNIYSVADGTVRVSKVDPTGYGNYVVIEHSNFCTLYAHLQKLEVKVGQRVKAGEIIGHMGNTGTSTGVHLHFEIRDCIYNKFWERDKTSGKYIHAVDPQPLLNKSTINIKTDREKVQEYFGFDNNTMAFLDKHPYFKDLYRKMSKDYK